MSSPMQAVEVLNIDNVKSFSKDAAKVKRLTAEMVELKAQKAELALKEDDLKERLASFFAKARVKSVMVGEGDSEVRVTVSESKGRRSLNKVLLIENGVAADVIEKSYKIGKPSTRVTVTPRGEKEWEGDE